MPPDKALAETQNLQMTLDKPGNVRGEAPPASIITTSTVTTPTVTTPTVIFLPIVTVPEVTQIVIDGFEEGDFVLVGVPITLRLTSNEEAHWSGNHYGAAAVTSTTYTTRIRSTYPPAVITATVGTKTHIIEIHPGAVDDGWTAITIGGSCSGPYCTLGEDLTTTAMTHGDWANTAASTNWTWYRYKRVDGQWELIQSQNGVGTFNHTLDFNPERRVLIGTNAAWESSYTYYTPQEVFVGLYCSNNYWTVYWDGTAPLNTAASILETPHELR